MITLKLQNVENVRVEMNELELRFTLLEQVPFPALMAIVADVDGEKKKLVYNEPVSFTFTMVGTHHIVLWHVHKVEINLDLTEEERKLFAASGLNFSSINDKPEFRKLCEKSTVRSDLG